MFLKRLLRRRRPASTSPAPLKIAAGSTSAFPVISHTFVYQELTALHDMLGADVKLFHTQDGDPAELHAAFRYLDQNRTRFDSDWDRHVADFKHYRSVQPERVESLLVALSDAAGMPRGDLEKRYEVMLAFTATRLIEEWGAQYVHTYFFYDQALNGLVASWVLGIPRGLSTYADHMMDDWPLKVVELHLRNAAVIVATSRRIAGELLEIGGAEIEPKIVVKPNGVDGDRFPVQQRAPVAGRPLELICITRVEPKKGLLELADTVKLCRDAGVDLRVHVIGAADKGSACSQRYAAEFAARIEQHGIGDILLRHGRMKQEEMGPLIAQADAFVAPFVETESGDKDGIPTAILEAMSSALPILATTAGSIPEIIDDGVEGLLVPQKDPVALAAAIGELAGDDNRLAEFSKNARSRFERDFDIRATEPRLHERVRRALAAAADSDERG